MKKVERKRIFAAAVAASAVVVVSVAQKASGQVTYTDLYGPLSMPAGLTYTNLNIANIAGNSTYFWNANGTFFGLGNAGAAGVFHPVVWNSSTGTDLLPAGYTKGYSATTDGTQQVGYAYRAVGGNSAGDAMLWNGSSGSYVDLDPGNDAGSGANATNGTNQVGFVETTSTEYAAIWSGTASSCVVLNPGGYTKSDALALSANQQVGWATLNNVQHAGLWTGTAASFVDLEPSWASKSQAYSTAGSQQGGYAKNASGGAQSATIWYGSAATAVNLQASAFSGTGLVEATNGSQQVGSAAVGGKTEAILWNGTANSYINLGALLPSSWTYSQATSISGNTVYGWAVDSSDVYHVLSWTVPEAAVTWNNTGLTPGGAGGTTTGSTLGSGDGSTSDITTTNNWNNGYTLAAYNDGFNVTFNDANNGHYNVNLASTVSPGSVTVNNSAGNYVITGSGSIAGTGGLTKTGTGSLTLGTANTFSGPTNLSGGTLTLANGGALSGSTSVTVAAGTKFNYLPTSNTQLTLPGSLTVTAGSGTVIGTSIGSTPTGAEINVAGAATIGAGPVTLNISGITGVAAGSGTYTLIHGGAGSSLNTGTLSINYFNDTSFSVTSVTETATDIQATITAITPLTAAYWNGGLSSNTNVWAVSDGSAHSNWVTSPTGGNTAAVPGSGTNVYISTNSPTVAPTATVLGANMTISTLTIADTTNGLGLNADGNTLTITPASSTTGITMNSGVPASTIAASVALGANQTWTNNSIHPLTVSGTISGSSNLTTAGTGTVALSGTNTFTGNTAVSSGTLLLMGSLALQNSNLTTSGVTFSSTVAGDNFTIGALSGNFNLALVDTASNPVNLSVGNNSATFSGVLSGTGGLTEVGSGVQVLSGPSTYTGVTNISAGTLNVGGPDTGSAGPLGNGGTILFTGGSLQYSSGNQYDYSSRFGTGANQRYQVDTNGQTVTWATGLTSSGGTLTKLGSGTLILTGASTFTGTTTVSAGTLQIGDGTVAGDNASLGSPSIVVNSSLVYNVNTSQTTASNITGGASGTLTKIGPGTLANTGTISIPTTISAGTLQLGNGNFGYDGTVSNNVVDNGALTADVIGSITLPGVISGTGTFSLINSGLVFMTGINTYSGVTTISSGGTLQLGNGNYGSLVGNIVDNSTLIFGDGYNSAYPGVISGSGVVNIALQYSSTIVFTGASTYGGTTTITGSTTVQLGNGTAGNDGSFASASIVNNAALVYDLYGSETYAGVISGTGTLTKTGAGTLELASPNTYTGVTKVTGGTLQVDTTGALPIGATLNVSAGAVVVAKNLGGGVNAQVLVLSGTPTLSGVLNLTTNDLLVHGSTLSAINAYVKQGYNGGAWNGTAGITSTSAAASPLYALGVIQNSMDGTPTGSTRYSSFDNQPASNSDVLVKYTYYGDANLDGSVTSADYTLIDAGYLSHGALTGWFNGDFNYDGVINGSDYTLIDNAFNTQGVQILSEVASPTAEIVGGTSAVPEPASLGLLGIGVAGLLGRRRRR